MESSGSNYYIHCIFQNKEKVARYLRVSPDYEGNGFSQDIMNYENKLFFEATWLGSSTTQAIGTGTTINAYESYFAGSLN